MIFCGFAYFLLTVILLKHHEKESTLAKAIGNDLKGKLSLIIYIVGMLLSFFNPWIALSLYFLVSLMWLIPDKRIENSMNENNWK